jgi:hypothetical protein
MHHLFIFVGAAFSAAWFGAHWGMTGAIASGVLGGILGIALASGIDEHVPLVGAIPRWLMLITGVGATSAGFGWCIDWIAGAHGAMVPAAIVGCVIGLFLCPGVRVG